MDDRELCLGQGQQAGETEEQGEVLCGGRLESLSSMSHCGFHCASLEPCWRDEGLHAIQHGAPRSLQPSLPCSGFSCHC